MPEPSGPRRLQSFEELFRDRFDELFASLFRYLDRLTGDPALASDIAQDTLLRLYERGAMPDELRPWLITVANNRLRSVQRQARRRAVLLSLRAVIAPPPSPAMPDAIEEAEERRAAVRAVLDTLPPRERQLLLLSSEGYSYREMARIVGVGETSVGTFLSRAKTAFVGALQEDVRATD